jgi:predicted metalloendopeptidase
VKVVCNAWRKENPVNPSIGAISLYDAAASTIIETLHQIVEANTPPVDTPDDRELFSMLKAFYKVCMNEAEIDRVGASPLAGVLDHMADVFPANDSRTLQQSDSAGFGDLTAYLGSIQEDPPMIYISTGMNASNPV